MPLQATLVIQAKVSRSSEHTSTAAGPLAGSAEASEHVFCRRSSWTRTRLAITCATHARFILGLKVLENKSKRERTMLWARRRTPGMPRYAQSPPWQTVYLQLNFKRNTSNVSMSQCLRYVHNFMLPAWHRTTSVTGHVLGSK